VVKALLGKEGVHVDEADAYGRTALHLAAAGNHDGVAKLLLLNGCDPKAADVHGLTPADVAAGTIPYGPHGRMDLPAPAAPPPAGSTSRAASSASPLPPPRNFFREGHIGTNPPAPAVAAVLRDAAVGFWNASFRANRCVPPRGSPRGGAGGGERVLRRPPE
jgi:hypothetical protein